MTAEARPVRILYIEDDPGAARLFQKRLEQAGYVVDLAASGAQGLSMFEQGDYDVLAVDWHMPDMDGLAVIRLLAAREVSTPMIVVTGSGDEQVAVKAMKAGARDYVVKDLEGGYLRLLSSVVEHMVAQQRLIQEKEQAEEALRVYAMELQERNKDLDAYASMVAHDLMGPLVSIMSFSAILEQEFATLSEEKRKEYLGFIVHGGQKMKAIIETLLLMARVRKLEVEMHPVEMGDVVAAVQDRLEPMIAAHEAELVVPDTWPRALGYALLIEEVWVNYITNAIKYGGTPPRVELGAQPGENGMVKFWVRDNGPGVAKEDQGVLFRPFKRLGQQKVEGNGLGLAIVHRIVTKLGGEVSVESEGVVEHGCVFSFSLPRA